MNSTELICKCGKQKSWITEGEKTYPCPKCGRQYVGVYNKKKLTIEAKEVNKDKEELMKYFEDVFAEIFTPLKNKI